MQGLHHAPFAAGRLKPLAPALLPSRKNALQKKTPLCPVCAGPRHIPGRPSAAPLLRPGEPQASRPLGAGDLPRMTPPGFSSVRAPPHRGRSFRRAFHGNRPSLDESPAAAASKPPQGTLMRMCMRKERAHAAAALETPSVLGYKKKKPEVQAWPSRPCRLLKNME